MSELLQTAKRARREAIAASRCSAVQDQQNRHQKLNGTVTGLTHYRRVDRGKMFPGLTS
jgi:hypothetical protein